MEDTQKQPPLLPRLAVMAGSAAYPLPKQQRYECDCEILVGASQETPRLTLRNVLASSFTLWNKKGHAHSE